MGPAPEDFLVIEVPRYAPTGEGTHLFLRVRKTGLTSYEAADRLAGALGARPGDVGMAGLKDRHAITEQWFSVPGTDPEAVRRLSLPRMEILEVRAHPHKLRTGHLEANRFEVRLVETGPGAQETAGAILARLSTEGLHNHFGPQRFGRGGETARQGQALLAGGKGPRDRRRRRLALSAIQSKLFNAYLEHRRSHGSLYEPLFGEVLKRTDSGGEFICQDEEEAAARAARREVVITGPLFGPKMRQPAPGSVPLSLEEDVLAEHRIGREDFHAWRNLAPGARRPLLVWPRDTSVAAEAGGGLWLRFTLPPGSYATVLMSEVTGTPDEELRAPIS